MSHQWTENNAWAQIVKWFASEVEKRTKGKVKIKIFWAEALGLEFHRVPGGPQQHTFVEQAGAILDPAAMRSDFRMRFWLDADGPRHTDEMLLDDVSVHCVP